MSLQSSASVNVTNTGGSNFSFYTEVLSFEGSKCYTLTKSGSTVTAGGTGVCSATVNGGSAFCLSASVNANGNLTLTNEGVCGFQDSSTVTFAQPSPGIYSASVTFPPGQNVSECITCGNDTLTVRDNVTLNVKKLCAKEQCEVRSDPPTDTPSPGGQWRPNYCIFGCGDGDGDGDDDGSSGDDDDGGGFAVIPPILPPPLFPPLFPPIFPVGPPGGGTSGSSSSPNGPPGDDSNNPGAVYPITTYLPPGADPPAVQGGTWVPIVNFTQAVPYCGADSNPSRLGSLVLDISVQPSQVYLCQVVANGSYAWMPYCPCQLAASNNRTFYYYNVTTLWRDNSTVLISNTSQLINTGATYLGGPVFVAGPLVASDSVDMCNASSVEMDSLSGCNGNPVILSNGLSTPIGGNSVIEGNLVVNGTTFSYCPSTPAPFSVSRISGCDGSSPVLFPTGVTTTDLWAGAGLLVHATNSIFLGTIQTNGATICPAGSEVTRIKTLGGCSGFPVNMPDGITSGAPSSFNAQATFNAPVNFNGDVTFAGFTSPFLATFTSPFLYWVPLQSSGTICPNYIVQPAWQAFSVTVLRIANSKFLFWNWGVNRGAFPYAPPLLQFTGGACTSVTFSTSSAVNNAYVLPLAYRPSDDFLSATDTYDNPNGGQYFYAYYTTLSSSAGTLSIEHPTQPTSVFPIGTFRFLPNTYTYL